MVSAFTHWAISWVPFDSAKPTCEKQTECFWLRMSLKPDPDFTWHNLLVLYPFLSLGQVWHLDIVPPNMKIKSVSHKIGSPSPLPGAYDLSAVFICSDSSPDSQKYVSVKSQTTGVCGSLPSSLKRSWVKMVTTYVNFFVSDVRIFESLI